MARRGEDTKKRILAAARKLVMDNGFSATSIDDILTAASNSLGVPSAVTDVRGALIAATDSDAVPGTTAGHRGWRGERWVGQTSPLYLFEPAVPERLHGALPEAKIVVVLREPVSRAYSHYWLEVRYGWERESFERALELEAERLEGGFDARRHFSYTARGRYAEQLERYFALFGRERVLVLLQDEMKNAPERVLERLGGFLDLDPAGFETQGGRVKHRNAALLPRWPALQRWARPIRERLPRFGYVVDGLNLERRSYPPMASGTRAALAERFAPEIDALEALTGVDASAWRTP